MEFGDTARYLNVGDTMLAKVLMVDETKRVQVTMKEQGLRKLQGGQVVEISHSKVPRVIGKGGSMIQMIKNMTNCRIFVGQNGRIWLDGDIENMVRRHTGHQDDRGGRADHAADREGEGVPGVGVQAHRKPKVESEVI